MQYSGPLTDKQKDLLQQFRRNVSSILRPEHNDEYLLRWIRAREWDIAKAEKMLRESLEWRRRMGVDTIVDDYKPTEVTEKYIPGGYLGHDKGGYPIWYELLGFVDVKGIVYSAPKRDIIRYRTYTTEYLFAKLFPELSKKFGKRIDKVVFICDLEGMGLRHLWKPVIEIYTEILSLVEANYPETLRKCYVVNAPAVVPILYNVVKPFLAEYTRSKIVFLGKNWKSVLLENIEADQLPVHWGGSLTDPDGDPYCRSQLKIWGTIPESYYLKNATANIDMSQFTTVSVGKAGYKTIPVQVDHPDSIISWNFWTESNDIGFGVYRQTDPAQQKVSEMEEILATSRVDSHLVPESGEVPCHQPGTYVVYFDNTYSWMTTKKVSYLVQVMTPDDELQHKVESTDF